MEYKKWGFAYFNMDTDRYQDIRIKKLKKQFKGEGVSVYDYILSEIYRVKGCFIMWDESTAFDVAEYWELKETVVNEIVNYCCYVGLFHKGLLASERILTSLSIQLRFLDMSRRAKRKGAKIPEKINLIPEEGAKIPEELQEPPEDFDKVKKSKEKKSRGEDEQPPSGHPLGLQITHNSPADIDLLKEKCILDKGYFLDVYCMKYQIDKNCLYKWLLNFNKWLMFQGIATKIEKDYRGHFGNWLYKQENKTEPEKWRVDKGKNTPSPDAKTDYQKERDRIKEREKKLLG